MVNVVINDHSGGLAILGLNARTRQYHQQVGQGRACRASSLQCANAAVTASTLQCIGDVVVACLLPVLVAAVERERGVRDRGGRRDGGKARLLREDAAGCWSCSGSSSGNSHKQPGFHYMAAATAAIAAATVPSRQGPGCRIASASTIHTLYCYGTTKINGSS